MVEPPSSPGPVSDSEFICAEYYTRTLWGEREQAACILATEERMIYQTLLSVSEVTMVGGYLWWHIFGSVDRHVSIPDLQSFPPGLVCSSFGLSSACLIPFQGCSR